MGLFKRTSNKELCERLIDRQKRVEELEQKVRTMEKATEEVETVMDSILWELINKYGKRYGKLVIPVPDVSAGHKIKAEKVGEEYILTIEKDEE